MPVQQANPENHFLGGHLFEIEWEGGGVGGVEGAYSRLGAY